MLLQERVRQGSPVGSGRARAQTAGLQTARRLRDPAAARQGFCSCCRQQQSVWARSDPPVHYVSLGPSCVETAGDRLREYKNTGFQVYGMGSWVARHDFEASVPRLGQGPTGSNPREARGRWVRPGRRRWPRRPWVRRDRSGRPRLRLPGGRQAGTRLS